MKASELRVGNWVNAFGGRTKKVDYLDIRDVAEGRLIEPYKPIELTSEILEKVGFEKVVNGVALRVLDGYVFIGSYFSRFPLTLEIDHHRMPLHHIKYLHQLQNLFHSLSDMELEIDL